MRSLIIIFTCINFLLQAQKPEKIYSNARDQKSLEYLKEQSIAWKKEIDKDPKNTEAWYNYYYANRNIGFNDPSRSPEEKQKRMNQVVDEMEKAIPDSYEYHLCRWMNGGWDMKLIAHLEEAQKLGPDRPEHLDYSIIFAEMKGDMKALDNWSKKKYEAGQFSTGLLYYNYNVLVGLPQNSILITNGDNDTFPIYYLQSLGIRRDVKVVHASLIGIDEYRKPIFELLGINEMDKSQDQRMLGAKNMGAPEDVVAHVTGNKKNYPVHLALTANQCAKPTHTENLYLTGLTYLYSKQPIDNIALLKRNFEKQYALDYIDKPFYTDISSGLVKIVNGNYIVPMLKLFDHYKTAGDIQRAEWIKQKLYAIVEGTDNEKEVKKQIAGI